MILNKFMRCISRTKTGYISCTHYPILHFLGNILHVLQHRLLHKTQVNSLRTEEILVDAPHRAVEKAWMFNDTLEQITCQLCPWKLTEGGLEQLTSNRIFSLPSSGQGMYKILQTLFGFSLRFDGITID